MRFILSFSLSILSAFACNAQDITGIWRGSFYNEYEFLFTGNKYRYEVQIRDDNGGLRGVTYSYQTTRFYGKASAIGKFSAESRNIILKENKMLDLKITGGGDGCLMTCFLEYIREGDREFLVGSYSSVSMSNDTAACGGGVVRLEKVVDSDFTKEDFLKKKNPAKTLQKAPVKPGQDQFLIKKNTTPPLASAKAAPKKPTTPLPKASTTKPPPPPTAAKPKPTSPSAAKPLPIPGSKPPAKKGIDSSTAVKKLSRDTATAQTGTPKMPSPKLPKPAVLQQRQNELAETIEVSSGMVTVNFYDNGEIDGDTISVYFNNRLVLSRGGLSARPIQLQLQLDHADDLYELVMVAENMGNIPPNTALMIVESGGQRHTVRLSSTDKKNAVVRFKRKLPAP